MGQGWWSRRCRGPDPETRCRPCHRDHSLGHVVRRTRHAGHLSTDQSVRQDDVVEGPERPSRVRNHARRIACGSRTTRGAVDPAVVASPVHPRTDHLQVVPARRRGSLRAAPAAGSVRRPSMSTRPHTGGRPCHDPSASSAVPWNSSRSPSPGATWWTDSDPVIHPRCRPRPNEYTPDRGFAHLDGVVGISD